MRKINDHAVKKQYSPECVLVLFIAGEVTGNTRKDKLEDLLRNPDINWPRFKALISYHELAPFAYLSLKRYACSLPQEMREFLRQSYYYCLWRTEFFRQEFARITNAFAQQGIDVVPIKGLGLVEDLYCQKPGRPMVDIDVLVREESLKVSERILQGLGYVKDLGGLKEEYWRQKQCHLSFSQDGHGISLLVEAHWALDFKRDDRKILPLLWERVRVNPRGERNIKLLSPEDTLFSLALHNRRLGKMLCLKYVCDIGLLLNKYKNEFDWDYVLREARQGKMQATMFFTLSQLELLDFPFPRAMCRELNVSSWKGRLVRYFIEKKVFWPAENLKKHYLTSHFLLYDNMWEPIKYILNIPPEQFAKYYGLEPYVKKTVFFYHLRWLYIPFEVLVVLIKSGVRFIGCLLKLSNCQKTTIEGQFNVFAQNCCAEKTSFFETNGWSMWPFLKPGTKLLVNRVPIDKLRVGDIILYRQDKQTVCHRLVKKVKAAKECLLYVRGDNALSLPECITEKMLTGKAVGIIRNNRIISLTGMRRRFLHWIIVPAAPLVKRILSVGKWFGSSVLKR